MKILIVTITFPPKDSPGALRGKALFKHLSDQGFETYVLTSTENKTDSFNEERIIRIPYPKFRILELLSNGGRILPVDENILWYFFINRKIEKIKNLNIDIVISTSPSNTTNLIASKFSRTFGCKWIAEFRDLWIDNPYNWYLLPFSKYIDLRIVSAEASSESKSPTPYFSNTPSSK